MLHSGFIGDKLGYRVILIIYILMSGAAATAFHFVPRCGEHKLQPHALLYNAGDTDEQGPNSIEKQPALSPANITKKEGPFQYCISYPDSIKNVGSVNVPP